MFSIVTFEKKIEKMYITISVDQKVLKTRQVQMFLLVLPSWRNCSRFRCWATTDPNCSGRVAADIDPGLTDPRRLREHLGPRIDPCDWHCDGDDEDRDGILKWEKRLKFGILIKYSGRHLMGSRLMGSFGYWDQIESNLPVPNYSLIVINQVNGIGLGLAKSDSIKRHLLYI